MTGTETAGTAARCDLSRDVTWEGGSSPALLLLLLNGWTPAATALPPVWRLMGDVCSGSELATAFCPLMCAVTMETGALAGTTEMAMPWLGGLMSDSGLVVPTGQLLTASFCRETGERQTDNSKGGRVRRRCFCLCVRASVCLYFE